MNQTQFIWLCLKSKFKPIKENTVFFDSFLGQYNDNPKYVSIELHRICPNAKIVWSISSKNKEKMPAYIKTVEYGSKDFYDYAMNSSAVVDNHMGIRTFGFRRMNSKILKWILKRPKQLAVATWHGTPLKKIGKDQISRKTSTFMSSIDYCVYGCDLTRDAVGGAFYVKNIMKPYGTPRNDILIGKVSPEEIVSLKEKLGIPVNKAVVLFAPTFRDTIELSGLKQLVDLATPILLEKLRKRFSKEFVLVFRAHHKVQEAISQNEELSNLDYINGNIGDDMTEYLLCTDVLITDYSSCMFDFALTGRPCFLYAPDKEHYINDERGTYLDFDSLPFPSGIDLDSLYKQISKFDGDLYRGKVDEFLRTINNVEKGEAAHLIALDIVNHLKEISCDI